MPFSRDSQRPYTFRDYDPKWVEEFQTLRDFLSSVFIGGRIEHVGSTSIKGMSAKPIIDVLILVPKMQPYEKEIVQMHAKGFDYARDYIAPRTLNFYQLNAEGGKLNNVHVCEEGSAKAKQFLDIRDYLRAHPDKAQLYAEEKHKNFLAHKDDYIGYRESKKEFLDEIEKEAYAWTATLSITLQPKKYTLALYMLLSAMLMLGGIMMIQDGDVLGWGVAGFFGIGILFFMVSMLPSASYLRLSSEGFEVCSLFRAHLTRWRDVDSFTYGKLHRRAVVMFNYSKYHKESEVLKKVARSLASTEGMLPDTYGKKAEELAALMNEWRERCVKNQA
ncbi:MAG: GrpB family protein [Candidatus Kerfeldbacteria bacterium]|nr:GrpB family protein [Candidatus Kerfeldbacteria bacterium]